MDKKSHLDYKQEYQQLYLDCRSNIIDAMMQHRISDIDFVENGLFAYRTIKHQDNFVRTRITDIKLNYQLMTNGKPALYYRIQSIDKNDPHADNKHYNWRTFNNDASDKYEIFEVWKEVSEYFAKLKVISDAVTEWHDISTDINGCEHWFHDTITNTDLALPIWYPTMVNLQTMKYNENRQGFLSEIEGIQRTISDWIAEGRLVDKYAYNIDIRKSYGFPKTIDVDKIIADFAKENINLSRGAIEHNFTAWMMGTKSGYRDVKNGYHLFTPCGTMNEFSINVTNLVKESVDWQQTYIA